MKKILTHKNNNIMFNKKKAKKMHWSVILVKYLYHLQGRILGLDNSVSSTQLSMQCKTSKVEIMPDIDYCWVQNALVKCHPNWCIENMTLSGQNDLCDYYKINTNGGEETAVV